MGQDDEPLLWTPRLIVPVKNSFSNALIDVVSYFNAFLIITIPPSLHSTT